MIHRPWYHLVIGTEKHRAFFYELTTCSSVCSGFCSLCVRCRGRSNHQTLQDQRLRKRWPICHRLCTGLLTPHSLCCKVYSAECKVLIILQSIKILTFNIGTIWGQWDQWQCSGRNLGQEPLQPHNEAEPHSPWKRCRDLHIW